MSRTRLNADDLFIPGLDTGIAFLRRPEVMWHSHPAAWIGAVGLSKRGGARAVCRESLAKARAGRADGVLAFEPLVAVAEDVTVSGGVVAVRGRPVWGCGGLGGWRKARFERDLLARMTARPVLPAAEGEMPEELVLGCAPHSDLLADVICHLSVVAQTGFSGRVRILAADAGLKARLESFVAALFPELADRVLVLAGAAHFAHRALIVMGTRALYPLFTGAEEDARKLGWAQIERNGFDANLSRLRRRPVRRGARRVLVSGGPVSGDLLAELGGLGFDHLEAGREAVSAQIDAVSGAEVAVFAPGADLALMLFAAPGALVVDLSDARRMRTAFGDWHGHAHAAGCRYLTVAGDVLDGAADAARLADLLRGVLEPGAMRTPRETIGCLREAGCPLGAALKAWSGVAEGDPELLIARAGVRAEEKRFSEALDDLIAAWNLLPARLPLLERIIRLANRLGRRDEAAAYLRLHALTFRWRHAQFLEECP